MAFHSRRAAKNLNNQESKKNVSWQIFNFLTEISLYSTRVCICKQCVGNLETLNLVSRVIVIAMLSYYRECEEFNCFFGRKIL